MDKKKYTMTMVGIGLLVVLAGVGTGWVLAGSPKGGRSNITGSTGTKVDENEAGIEIKNEEDWNTAEGKLIEGGIDGTGTHHLEREGGPSKNVYLTSTVIDLESFVGKDIQVWGETVSTQKAGWFMDVVKVKVIN